MHKYYCKWCEYGTNKTSDYKKHRVTKKHIQKYNMCHNGDFLAKISSSSSSSSSKVAKMSKNGRFFCDFCDKEYTRFDNLKRHLLRCNGNLSDSSDSDFSSSSLPLEKTELSKLSKKSLCKKDDMCDIEQGGVNKSRCFFSKLSKNGVKKSHFECVYCCKKYTRCYNKERHERVCKKRGKPINFPANIDHLNNAETMEIKTELRIEKILSKHANDQNNFIKKELEYYKKMLNMAGGMANKAVRSLTHVVTNYADAPPLEKINTDDIRRIKGSNNDDKEEYEYKLIDEVFYAYNHNNIGKYIGDIIIALYKKDNPNEQSIWNTDTSRLTYLIKKINDDDDDDDDGDHNNNDGDIAEIGLTKDKCKSSKWIVDKKGVETIEYIIDPIVNKIKILSKVFRDDNCPDPDDPNYDYDEIDHDRVMRINTIYVRLMTDIDDKKIHNQVLKYISSYFYHNKEKQRT